MITIYCIKGGDGQQGLVENKMCGKVYFRRTYTEVVGKESKYRGEKCRMFIFS